MVIIFFDANDNKIYICAPNEVTKTVNADDPNILDFVPNDDILYVENAHYITKQQFAKWLNGEVQFESSNEVTRFSGFMDSGTSIARNQTTENKPSKWYLHPTKPGTVVLNDIHTKKYPNGVAFNGKWHFIAIDDIGEEELEASSHYRFAIAKGKLERVDAKFVKDNMHKFKQHTSPSEAALNAILVPAEIKVATVLSEGGLRRGDDDIPEFLVEG